MPPPTPPPSRTHPGPRPGPVPVPRPTRTAPGPGSGGIHRCQRHPPGGQSLESRTQEAVRPARDGIGDNQSLSRPSRGTVPLEGFTLSTSAHGPNCSAPAEWGRSDGFRLRPHRGLQESLASRNRRGSAMVVWGRQRGVPQKTSLQGWSAIERARSPRRAHAAGPPPPSAWRSSPHCAAAIAERPGPGSQRSHWQFEQCGCPLSRSIERGRCSEPSRRWD